MTATVGIEPGQGSFDGDAVTGWLSEVLVALGGLAAGTAGVGDAVRIDRIALLERVKAAAAAAQCAEIVAFARSQVGQQQSAGVNYRRLGQGIGEQVALATGTSGWHGARKLTFARDLVQELPQTFALLAAGRISEYAAQLVLTETSHLDPDVRRRVDTQLTAQHVEELGPKQAAGLARRLAYAADPLGAVKRAAKARSERHVSLRPAPDTMTVWSGLRPVGRWSSCLAPSLANGEALFARSVANQDRAPSLTDARRRADAHPVTLNLTVPLEHLTDPDDHTPADLPGYGPIPAGLVDDILAKAKDRVWWRRLFTAPTRDGQGRVVVGGDPKLRRFGGWLATLLRLRDAGTLRCPDPPPRPHSALGRRRPHHLRQRPCGMRTP